jgi:PAS domain S-box-containing protein
MTDRDELEENVQRLISIIDSSDDAIIGTDLNGIIVSWNYGAELGYGYSPAEAVGKSISIIIPLECRAEFLDVLERIKRGERLKHYETVRVRKDGTRVEVSVTVSPARNKKGEVIGASSIARDITERKHAESELRESEQRYRLVVDRTADAIMMMQDGMIKLVNPMAANMTGFSEKELLSKPFLALIHPDDRAMLGAHHQRRLKGAPLPTRYEFRLLTKDGSAKWTLVSEVITSWKEHSATLIVLTDITELKAAEDVLRKSEEKYRQLVELAREGIWTIDADANTTYVNPRMAEMLGYTREEMMERHPFSFMDEGGQEIAQKELDRRKQGIKERHDFEFLRKDGQRILASLETSPLVDEAGNYKGALAVVSDITERRIAEKDLVLRTKDAEDAKVRARAYFDFLAHDIANLLSPIMAYAEMMSLDAGTPESCKLKAGKIVDQARRASSFILSLRRLEDAELIAEERTESKDIGAILVEPIARVKAEYGDKRISATVINAAGQVRFKGGKHLENIILGILENSIALAGRDEIALEVKATLVGEKDRRVLKLELTDDGPGIPDGLKECFIASKDPRMQFETGISRGVASTLLISSAIVNGLGGKLWIEDRIPGDCSKGSRIVFEFPQEGFFGT